MSDQVGSIYRLGELSRLLWQGSHSRGNGLLKETIRFREDGQRHGVGAQDILYWEDESTRSNLRTLSGAFVLCFGAEYWPEQNSRPLVAPRDNETIRKYLERIFWLQNGNKLNNDKQKSFRLGFSSGDAGHTEYQEWLSRLVVPNIKGPKTSVRAQTVHTNQDHSSQLNSSAVENSILRRQHSSRSVHDRAQTYSIDETDLEDSKTFVNSTAARHDYDANSSNSILDYVPRRSARKRNLSQAGLDLLLDDEDESDASQILASSTSMDRPISQPEVNRGTEASFLGPGYQPLMQAPYELENNSPTIASAPSAADNSDVEKSVPLEQRLITLRLPNSKSKLSHLASNSQSETTHVQPRYANKSYTPHKQVNEPRKLSPDNPVITHLLIKKSKKGAKLTILKNVAGKALEKDFVCATIFRETGSNQYGRINFRLTWSEEFVENFSIKREEEAEFIEMRMLFTRTIRENTEQYGVRQYTLEWEPVFETEFERAAQPSQALVL